MTKNPTKQTSPVEMTRTEYNQGIMPMYDDPRREKWDTLHRASQRAVKAQEEVYVYETYKLHGLILSCEEPNTNEYYIATPDGKIWSVKK